MSIELKNGNCLDLMKELPNKSIDLLICDLPYGEINNSWDTPIDMKVFWKEFKRIRKSRRTACIHFCSTRFGYKLIQSWEKGFKNDLVLKKRNKCGFLSAKHRPLRNHEMVYFFYDECPEYYYTDYHKRIGDRNYKASDMFISKNKEFENQTKTICYEPALPGSVFETEINLNRKRLHPTEKPQDILQFLIKYWSQPGQTILDPTMGSGSTGEACQNLKRNFIGFELDKDIYAVATKRFVVQDHSKES
tara:strand:+ start:1064 stop:1807 length:744 start_codon:yes stop_codon:yes gene_type:complete